MKAHILLRGAGTLQAQFHSSLAELPGTGRMQGCCPGLGCAAGTAFEGCQLEGQILFKRFNSHGQKYLNVFPLFLHIFALILLCL